MSQKVIALLDSNFGGIRFLLDSGAFTAWKAGKKISLDEYCKFIESLPFEPWRYFTLDVIGDPKGTIKNYELMIKRGFKPVPIFTRGEDISVLDDYYKTSDLVAVGGLVGTRGNRGFIKGIMEKIGKRKTHWLGFTNQNFVYHYKPYSVDSSSWEAGARYGAFKCYKGNGKFIFFKKSNFTKEPTQETKNLISSYGYDPNLFSKNKAWHGSRSINRILNAHSIVRASLAIEKKIKTKLFSAATTTLAVSLLIDGFKKEVSL